MNRGSKNVRSAFALMIIAALFIVLPFGKLAAQPFVAWNVAGSGVYGSADGLGAAAQFAHPQGVAFDNIGNLYVADSENHRIRKINRFGQVTTIAGSVQGYQDGPANQAQFRFPTGVAVDQSGNIYVADNGNHRIRKITPTNVVTTIAGGQAGDLSAGSASQLTFPYYLVLDADGNIYVTDNGNYRIRKITPTGTMTTLAGSGSQGSANGQGSSAQFWDPRGIIIDASGNLYVADGAIRKITPSGAVTTVLGDSTSGYTNVIFDTQNNLVGYRNVDNTGGVITDPTGSRIFANANTNTIQRLAYYSGLYLITEVIPTSAKAGETVTIKGFGLASTAGILFGGIPAQSFQIISDNEIRAVVPVGGSGALSVQTPSGQSSVNVFKYLPPPIINNFQPTIAAANTPITINGSGFIGLQSISIGGVPVQSYTVVSPTQITVVLGSNAVSGDVSVVTEIDSTSKSGFTFVAPPSITSFSPPSAAQGDTVLIQGRNLTYITSVNFGGSTAQLFHIVNDSLITAIVGAASSGAVSITNIAGTAPSNGFTFIAPPAITSFTPTVGGSGTSVTITGSGFTGVSAVSFGGVPAQSFTVQSPTQLSAVVASGASGLVRVENRAGVATQAGFTFYISPVITGFTPSSAQAGQTITISGRNFTGATQVRFGGTNAQSFTVANDTTIQAVVGAGSSGNVSVTNPVGTGTLAGFSFLVVPTSFSAQNPTASNPQNSAYPIYTFVANGMPSPTYSLASGSLPTGLTLSASGVLSGTPSVMGSYTFTVQASNSVGSVNSNSITITVTQPAQAPTAFTAQSPVLAATANIPYPSYTFVANGIPAPTYYGIYSGSLPPGLNISSNNGILSGTPTNVGSYTFTIYASNGLGYISTTPITIVVFGATPNAFFAQSPMATTRMGTFYTGYQFIANGDPVPTYTVESGSLPTGLSLNSTGYLSGICSAEGMFTFTIKATNSLGTVTSNPITITVLPSVETVYVTTLTNNLQYGYFENVAVDALDNAYVADNSAVLKISPSGVVTTLAGSFSSGYADGTGSTALFNRAYASAVDALGNVYIADQNNHRVRKITPSGVVTTLAGNGTAGTVDGVGTSAQLNSPSKIAVDGLGNVYVVEETAGFVRKITPSGIVSTFIQTSILGYSGFGPYTIAADVSGNVYVQAADTRIVKITPSGTVSTLAGGTYGYMDGTSAMARFGISYGLTVDGAGNVYVAESGSNSRIRKITPSGIVTTLAGTGIAGNLDGLGTIARFSSPRGIAVSASGNIYVADAGNGSVRKISVTSNSAPTAFSAQTPAVNGLVGTAYTVYSFVANGTPTPTYSIASGTLPTGLTLSSVGVLSGTPTVAGTYTFSVQASNAAGSVNSNPVTITINQAPSAFSAQTPATSGVVGTAYTSYAFVANGTPAPTYTVASGALPTGLTLSTAGVLSGTPTALGTYTFRVQASNMYGSIISPSIVISITGVGQAPTMFTSEFFRYNFNSRYVGMPYPSYTFVADGNPTPTYTVVSGALPPGLSLSASGVLSGTTSVTGTYTFSVQASNSAGSISSNFSIIVRPLPPSNGYCVSTVGLDSASIAGKTAQMATDASGNIYTVDRINHRILKIDPSGFISTFAGSGIQGYADGVGISAQFNVPTDVAVDATGNVYVADGGNYRIRKISPSGIVSTLAGDGTMGYVDGSGTNARFSNNVYAIAADGFGNIYVSDAYRLRKINSGGDVTTLAGSGVSGSADGIGLSAEFQGLGDITTDISGNLVVIDRHRIRKVSSLGEVSTLAGTVNGCPSSFSFTDIPVAQLCLYNPSSIAIDLGGNIYVVDSWNYAIRKISTVGIVSTIAGGGPGSDDGDGSVARFLDPRSLTIDLTGNIYVGESTRLRKIVVCSSTIPTAFSAQTPINSGFVGIASTAYTFVANGTPAPTYSLASGALPTGLTLSASGVLSGTPTAAGSYTFTVQASNSAGTVNSSPITITVTNSNVAPSAFSAQSPATSGAVGTSFALYTFVANGTPAPTYSVASGTLPTGLSLSSAGVLSGTPTAAGSYAFTVQASNGAGNVNSSPVTITVTQAPSGFSAQAPTTSGAVGTAYTFYTFVANGTPAPTYTVASGTLPTGLTLSVSGVLSGTPTVAGSYTFTVQANNSAGSINSASVTIIVTQPTTTISSFAPASATIGNTVTIRGAGFTGASVVRFGGTAALSFVVASDTVITARVGTGASGAVSVTTPLGTASLAGFLYNVPPPPVVNTFSPTSARPGDTVIIRGVNFLSASTVSFGGVSMRYTVVSDSVIHAFISASAVSGAVNVITQGGTSNINGFIFIPLPPAPRITAFTPNRAAEGASVVITGANLTGATRVKFGAFDAASFAVNSATQITAVVGAGSSGAVSVQTAGGTFSLNGFTFVPPAATLSGFMPTSAAIGQTVVITGTNLSSALAVEFGGRSAVFTVNSDSQITATVPAGALSGTISVTTLAGAASIAGFTFLAPPVVSSFSPTSAGVGASVVIAGSNFSGADTVRIGGVVASFIVNSASQITATVPSGAASGSVSVRTPYGTGSLAGFVFIPSPAITSFSPAVAGAGDVVTINGTNFTGASAVSFGGIPAASFTVVSATRITAAPASGGASGDISVTTPNGTGARSGFSFAGVPVITAFSPTGATGGDTVTISGTGFVGVSALAFGNTAATSFTIVSPTEIKAIVSPRGSTGAVRLVTPGGTASLNGFTFTAPLPVITGFSPASATVEQTVTITGRNFAGDLYSTLAVSFGGRAAGNFTVVNDSTITAAVGGGATGSVSVRTPGGTANRAGFTFIPAAPIITGFTPASSPAGATITISGNNFFAASSVKFGGIAGTSLVVVNDSTVTVRVAASGATGVVTLTTPSGTGTSASAFTFIPAPVISAFAPATASVGDTVSIAGTGFTGATAVRFGGTAALRFTVVSDSEIQAVVNGGSTGAITVVSPNGTGTLSGFTYLPPAPRITSFTPATAAAGTSVVINGNYFTGATAVNFGGIAATSFTVNSATRITAVVAAGSASGDVTVISPNGTGTLAGFTFLAAPPAIASFSPTSAPAGGTVLIRGTGFTGATAVRFGGIAAASFTRTGDTLISARVAASGASGDVSVVSVAGTGTLSGFVFIPAPSISNFTPTSAAQGDTVTIAGANFLGVSAVSFGGAAANIVSVNATQIVVLVGSGATGSLSLTTPGGSASKTGFTYLPPGPRITGFTPATATPGTSVVISGSSFTGASSVSFGGIAAQSFVVNSATRITAVVPATALSGDVSVTTPLGTAAMAGFTFTPVPAPVITSFTPTTMPSGSTTTTMTINGRNFTGATAVSVGGVAVPFTIVSATRITARLTGAIGGAVSVTTPGGTATMAGFVLTSLFDMKSDNLTSANGNSSNSNADELNAVAGVSNLDAPPLTAFPNPASESVTLTGSGFAEGRLVSVTLINTLGQTVLTLTQQPIGGILQANVDVRQVPSGAYTAVLSDGVVQRAVRFVKR